MKYSKGTREVQASVVQAPQHQQLIQKGQKKQIVYTSNCRVVWGKGNLLNLDYAKSWLHTNDSIISYINSIHKNNILCS